MVNKLSSSGGRLQCQCLCLSLSLCLCVCVSVCVCKWRYRSRFVPFVCANFNWASLIACFSECFSNSLPWRPQIQHPYLSVATTRQGWCSTFDCTPPLHSLCSVAGGVPSGSAHHSGGGQGVTQQPNHHGEARGAERTIFLCRSL